MLPTNWTKKFKVNLDTETITLYGDLSEWFKKLHSKNGWLADTRNAMIAELSTELDPIPEALVARLLFINALSKQYGIHPIYSKPEIKTLWRKKYKYLTKYEQFHSYGYLHKGLSVPYTIGGYHSEAVFTETEAKELLGEKDFEMFESLVVLNER